MAAFRHNPFLMKDRAGADNRGSVLLASDQMDELKQKFVKVSSS